MPLPPLRPLRGLLKGCVRGLMPCASAAAVSSRRSLLVRPLTLPLQRGFGMVSSADAAPLSQMPTATPAALADEPVLMDKFNRFHNYLRISLTERCNLRCQYCMPEDGVELTPKEKLLSADEVVRVATLFVAQGVDKIRFTGGEPMVRKDVLDIIRRVGELRSAGLKTIAMTTNGITLARHLPALQAAGLNAVNISLDTLDPFQFQIITRRKGHDKVVEAIETALHLGIPKVKINCVVMRDINSREIVPFVAMTEKKPVEVRFIEYMPFDGNKWSSKKMFTYAEMLDLIHEAYPGRFHRLQDEPNDTSKTWAVDGFAGRVGFVTSMSEHFCSSCNRLRMTADGNLKVCLFGANEINLRDAMRRGDTDEQLSEIVSMAVKRKKARHAGMFEIAKTKNRPMITIGG